ncbi:MAG: type II toxin-antitoxin system VapC family toxin [Kiritimatiellae bacterium]|nr:type II toxin-antitoxin system VapC family toxin [Kiritimatiellia bacterium]
MILLDTCALLWWTLAPEQLSKRASAACEGIGQNGGCISSITIWEIGIKWRRGVVDLGGLDLREYARRVREIEGLEIVPVTGTVWVENILLDWEHRDPADRTIVATAAQRQIPIVTKDGHITGFYEKTIW